MSCLCLCVFSEFWRIGPEQMGHDLCQEVGQAQRNLWSKMKNCKGHKPFPKPSQFKLHFDRGFHFFLFFFSKRDSNPRSLRFVVGDQRGSFFSLSLLSQAVSQCGKCHFFIPWWIPFLFFLMEHLWKFMKKFCFQIFDSFCDLFWVLGGDVVMDMLLQSRKAPPLDPKLIPFFPLFTKLSFWFYKSKGSLIFLLNPIEVLKTHQKEGLNNVMDKTQSFENFESFSQIDING